tara:strand:- start:2444 stop:3199 length:756 start_codon:yes stop_codon:yes gene_type:complete
MTKGKSKNFYFLCSLPRAGNTLLGSILNQSKKVQLSANSIIPDILYNLLDLKDTIGFKNFPYHKGIDNIASNIFNLYYDNVNVKNIIDNSSWGTPGNLHYLKQSFTNRKFIILTRPILECLASFIRVEKPQNVEQRCNQLMDKTTGRLFKSLWSIQNIIQQKENYIHLKYDDLISDPKTQIQKIYNFLNIEPEHLNYDQLNQFSFDNTFYDDSHIYNDTHTIRVNKIKKLNYKIEDYLPPNVIEKYKGVNI